MRLARPGEAATVHAIMLAAFAEYRGVLQVESGAHSETVADVQAAMRQGGAVLALVDTLAVGSARYLVEPEDVYVGRVAVLPSHRRRGVASAMMRFLEERTIRLGQQSIRIAVRDSLPGNVALYTALDYQVVSIEPHPRGADRVWTMRKQVGPART